MKYADPELDLGGGGNSIFDDLEDEPKEETEIQEGIPEDTDKIKSDKTDEDEGSIDTKPDVSAGTTPNFQAKFLEFSQRKTEERNSEASGDRKVKDEKSRQEPTASQIAALLQNTDNSNRVLERRDSVKSDGSGKDQLPKTPTAPSTPKTPSGLLHGMDQTNPLATGLGSRPPYPSTMQSPVHQKGYQTPQPSPGSAGVYPPTQTGLPSPKVMPSPKSNVPSPRTPVSPFGQQPVTPGGQVQQQSPFSQAVHSPFSPPVTSPFTGVATSSAPQSPFQAVPNRTQSPFTLATSGSGQSPYGTPVSQASPVQTSNSPGHTPPTSFPMQRSPRGTITPTNQYMHGTFAQQAIQGPPPRGTTLTPTPNSILYGQSVTSQHNVRGQAPGIMSGPRASQIQPGMVGGDAVQIPPQGMDIGSPGAPPQMRMPMQGLPSRPDVAADVRFPGQHGPPGMHVQRPTGPVHPYGPPGQQQAPGQPSMRMPGMRPPMQGMGSPGAQGGKSGLLQDQPLLIQDLLEQVSIIIHDI